MKQDITPQTAKLLVLQLVQAAAKNLAINAFDTFEDVMTEKGLRELTKAFHDYEAQLKSNIAFQRKVGGKI